MIRAKKKRKADAWVLDLVEHLDELWKMKADELREVARRLKQGYCGACFGTNEEYEQYVRPPTLYEGDVFLAILQGGEIGYNGNHEQLEGEAEALGCEIGGLE